MREYEPPLSSCVLPNGGQPNLPNKYKENKKAIKHTF